MCEIAQLQCMNIDSGFRADSLRGGEMAAPISALARTVSAGAHRSLGGTHGGLPTWGIRLALTNQDIRLPIFSVIPANAGIGEKSHS